MSDEHNPDRYGEMWPQHKIESYLKVLWLIKPYVVFSGGWAWHFMSPSGHVELKHAHDHKDVDLMVPPRTVSTVLELLREMGFKKVGTRFDNLPSAEEFRRYERVEEPEGLAPFRITIDFFVKDVPTLTCPGGWLVVNPATLLTFYKTIHSSKSCFAVQAATKILARGESVIGRQELVQVPQGARV